MYKAILITLALILSFTLVQAQTINSEQSTVTFNISNMGINKVKGSFGGMQGTIKFDKNDLSTALFDVCIAAETVNTKNKGRDKHLRNEDFFEVSKYTTICFKSSQITKTANGYKTTGSLNMHGISKTIDINFTFVDNKFEGSFSISRDDFKIGDSYGSFMVGKQVDIQIVCVVE